MCFHLDKLILPSFRRFEIFPLYLMNYFFALINLNSFFLSEDVKQYDDLNKGTVQRHHENTSHPGNSRVRDSTLLHW